jgi:ATP-dependent Clp protease adaptor protein ClpS
MSPLFLCPQLFSGTPPSYFPCVRLSAKDVLPRNEPANAGLWSEFYEMSEDNNNNGNTPSTGLALKTRPKVKKPSMYKVLMLNDDYTPMEFVVHVLEAFFHKNREEATQVMLHVHRRGVGICGVYTYEVAETKVAQVVDFARRHEHPLQLTLEKD